MTNISERPAELQIVSPEGDMGFENIYEWARNNGKTELVHYIDRMEKSFRDVGMSKEGFLYDPKNQKVKVIVKLDRDFQKGHELNGVTLLFGGVANYLVDPAACAVVYPLLGEGFVPLTLETLVRNTAPVVIGSTDLVISAEFQGKYKPRLSQVLVQGFQGGKKCFEATVKISTKAI